MAPDPGIDEEAVRWLTPGSPGRDALRRDPFSFYERLRRHDRVYETPDGRWLISGHAESLAFLQGRRTHSHDVGIPPERETVAHRIFMGSMLFKDPPEHTRLRRTVSSWFSPRGMQRLADRVDQYARALLEPLRTRGELDLKRGPAFTLPVLVIADILGLPPEDFDGFSAWSKALLYLDEHPDAEGSDLDDVNRLAEQALDYFTLVIEERRRRPGDDLISSLVNPAGGAEPLTDEEIVAMCVILHIGGHTTTSDLLPNGILHMIRNPGTFAVLRSSPDLVPRAVEEFLRYDPPVGVTTARTASADLEIGGKLIPRGAVVHAVLAAADRDPLVFDDPARFDVTRVENRHIAFAAGNHLCIGAHLARLEAQAFLRVLVTEFPDLELAVAEEELSWVDSWLHRGLESLPVAWDA